MVVRQASKIDKRKVHVSLTDFGLEKVTNAPAPLQENFINHFNNLNEWETNHNVKHLAADCLYDGCRGVLMQPPYSKQAIWIQILAPYTIKLVWIQISIVR